MIIYDAFLNTTSKKDYYDHVARSILLLPVMYVTLFQLFPRDEYLAERILELWLHYIFSSGRVS